MAHDPKNADRDLEELFRKAVSDDGLPDGLMARVLADAARQQSSPDVPVRVSEPRWRRWIDACGGWTGLGGMVAASTVGFWIGVSPPADLPDAGAYLLGFDPGLPEEAASLSAFGWDVEEG